jgi:hypothetical protein
MIPPITYCCRRILIPKCPPSLHKILVLVSLDGWDFQKKILMSVCSSVRALLFFENPHPITAIFHCVTHRFNLFAEFIFVSF